MGDGQSKNGEAQYDAEHVQNLHNSLKNVGTTPEAAFEEAFRGDDFAQSEIKRIAMELDSAGQRRPGVQPAAPLSTHEKRAQARQTAEERAVEKAAQSEADTWLRKQLLAASKAQQPRVPDDGETVVPPQCSQPKEHERRPASTPKTRAQSAGRTKKSLPSQARKVSSEDPRVGVDFAVDEQGSAPVPELYRILGIRVDATFDEVKAAFRREALKWHPDKNRDRMENATRRFHRISDAFDTLYDAEKRAAYDVGQVKMPSTTKRLAGHGWASVADHDDAALTPAGLKLKKQSWGGYIYFGGRIDDTNPVLDDGDPRAPQERIKVFWRHVGERAHQAREQGGNDWLTNFVSEVWAGTPTRWPKSVQLASVNQSAQQEWAERRMVFQRRKQKVLIHLELHGDYLDIPDREEKEKARMRKIWPNSFG